MQDLPKLGGKKTLGLASENKLNEIYSTKYRINLDHQILADHSVFYLQALYNDLAFQVTLAPASQVGKGSDPTKLKYKPTNNQLECEMICNESLVDEASSVYSSRKEFAHDHVNHYQVVPIAKNTDMRVNIKVNAQRRSMQGILLLFLEPYVAGARDSEKFIFLNLKKVTINILAQHAVQLWHRKSVH